MRRATFFPTLEGRKTQISIHALLAESDGKSHKLAGQKLVFLSTLSLRRATPPGIVLRNAEILNDFYPRSPCGERHEISAIRTTREDFYPRSPCGERRVTVLGIQHRVGISIHALLAESDNDSRRQTYQTSEFLSTLSLRRATSPPVFCYLDNIISIHALLAESDRRRGIRRYLDA